MPVPGLSRNDMTAISNREIRTEKRLEKALARIEFLKKRNIELRRQLQALKNRQSIQ